MKYDISPVSACREKHIGTDQQMLNKDLALE